MLETSTLYLGETPFSVLALRHGQVTYLTHYQLVSSETDACAEANYRYLYHLLFLEEGKIEPHTKRWLHFWHPVEIRFDWLLSSPEFYQIRKTMFLTYADQVTKIWLSRSFAEDQGFLEVLSDVDEPCFDPELAEDIRQEWLRDSMADWVPGEVQEILDRHDPGAAEAWRLLDLDGRMDLFAHYREAEEKDSFADLDGFADWISRNREATLTGVAIVKRLPGGAD